MSKHARPHRADSTDTACVSPDPRASCSTGAAIAAAPAPAPQVLILNSSHHGYEGPDDLVEGIEERLLAQVPNKLGGHCHFPALRNSSSSTRRQHVPPAGVTPEPDEQPCEGQQPRQRTQGCKPGSMATEAT